MQLLITGQRHANAYSTLTTLSFPAQAISSITGSTVVRRNTTSMLYVVDDFMIIAFFSLS